MKKIPYTFYAIVSIVLGIAFVVDRVTKYIAATGVWDTIVIIPGALEIAFVQNYAILFFIQLPIWGIISIVTMLLLLFVTMIVKEVTKHMHYPASALLLTLVGAVSNMIDRIKYGYVIDFIHIPFWSVFNFADIYIVLGIGIYLILSWKQEERQQ